MEKAIKLAIEKGGYNFKIPNEPLFPDLKSQILLDPAFWVSLGKALRWERRTVVVVGNSEMESLEWFEVGMDKHESYHTFRLPKWQFHALRFFEIKLTGGDEKKFWEELLNINK